MAENIKLLKLVEQFILNKCTPPKNSKNFSYELNYHPQGENTLPIIYDSTHFIPCIISQNKKKELDELNKANTDSIILIKDFKFDLAFYKKEKNLKIINCNIVLIINDFSIINKKENNEENNSTLFDKEKIADINKENRVLKKLGKFLFDYIKKNKDKNKNITLNNLFLDKAVNNIKLFNNDDINDIEQINGIKNLEAEIIMKEGKNLEDILDELNPEFKEELIAKYIDEMPDEIVNLHKKYKKINFTKEIYQNYINKGKDKMEEEK